MGVGARIILTQLTAPALVGGARSARPPVQVSWRLLGPNNRQLGRGPEPLALADAPSALERLRAAADELVVVAVASSPGPLWRWRGELDGEPVAVSARGFQRQRDAFYNAQQFRAALVTAELVQGVPRQLRARRSLVVRGAR